MRTFPRIVVSALAISFMLAGCGDDADSPPASEAAGPTPPQTAPETTSTASASPTEGPETSADASPSSSPEPSTAYPDNIGEGVTVAILDRGIDWRHPDFLNADRTTRIKWILDMSGQSWCTDGNPPPREISEAEINAALASGGDIDHRDAVGHGTATAGMAAGNGSALDGAPYRGVAPGADLIILKTTSEGAPALGSMPAEPAFNACMDNALDWLDVKIDELGQPAVALWNAGTQWGPMDGTSVVSRKIASVFGPDRPGRVWVASSGDEGSLPNHAGGDYGPGAPLEVPFEKVDDGSSYPTAWYSGAAPAHITIEFADGTVIGPVGPGAFVQNESGVSITQYTPGTEFYPWQSTSGDRAIWMQIDGNAGAGVIRIESQGGSGRIDLYGDLLGSEPLTSSIEFLDHLVPGRITDVTATNGVIGVAVHVARHEYIDMNGQSQDFSAEGLTGDLWLKSSGGPTRDGRMAIDVSAEGQNAYAALGQDSMWSVGQGNLPRDGEGWYIRFGGTSAAGPIVVGTVALMLEVDPTLTADQVREIFHATAIADEFTGEVPNQDWGYGKLDIMAAVEAVTD